MSSSGIAVGLNKGYPVEKRERAARPSHSKAVSVSIVHCGNASMLNYIYFCFLPETLEENQVG